MILSVMGKYFRQLYTARLCLEAGGGRDQFMSLWNMRYSYQADKLLDAARKFSLPWCRHTVRRCAQTDLAPGNEMEVGRDNVAQLAQTVPVQRGLQLLLLV